MRNIGYTFVLGLCLWSGSVLGAERGRPSTSDAEIREIAVEAYQYFYSLITMDVTRRVATNLPAGAKPGMGPMNQFHHMRAFPTAEFKDVVRPNFDTLYSSAWLDLTKEPMILSVPDTGGRYYLMPMLDMWTDVFASPGKRTSGTGAGHFAIVSKGWSGKLPEGVQRIEAPTQFVWIIGRTQTNGPADYAHVNKIQDGYRVTALSDWGKTPKVPKFVADPDVDMKTAPLVQVNNMPAARYFTYGAELLKQHGSHITDWSQDARLRRLGIEPGKSFEFERAPEAVKKALEAAVVEGLTRMKEKLPTLARVNNGWQMNTDTMGVYGNFYLKRAIVAMVGLGANQPEDAIYPLNVADADGNAIEGGKKYVLHFTKEQLPPVEAFWSVTMYDAEGFQIANPLNRFAIGDRDALKYNSDGSLDIYIQSETPGAEKESNWLPSAAKGVLGITMRLYAPRAAAIDGRWNPPAIQRQ